MTLTILVAIPLGTVLTFSGADSTDPAGAIDEYRWVFGDGETATGVEVSHAFDLPGMYTVFLTVEDTLVSKRASSNTPRFVSWTFFQTR